MPTLTQLEYVLAVYRHGHFGRAAAACRVSQPTLSAQVRKVEEELGVTLFDRNRKPVAPTEKGQALVEQAEVVVAAHERLVRLASGQHEEIAGRLELGVIPTLAPFVLPWFVRDFSRKHPKVELEISERTTEQMLLALQNGRLDAGILATPLEARGIEEHPLFYDPFYLYAESNETVLESDEVDVETLDPDRLWLLADGHCFRTQMLRLCGSVAGSSSLRSVHVDGGSFETLRNLIDATSGYTLFPETFVRTLPRPIRLKQVRSLQEPTPTREVSLVVSTRTWKGDVVDALEHAIKQNIPRPLRAHTNDHVVQP